MRVTEPTFLIFIIFNNNTIIEFFNKLYKIVSYFASIKEIKKMGDLHIQKNHVDVDKLTHISSRAQQENFSRQEAYSRSYQ